MKKAIGSGAVVFALLAACGQIEQPIGDALAGSGGDLNAPAPSEGGESSGTAGSGTTTVGAAGTRTTIGTGGTSHTVGTAGTSAGGRTNGSLEECGSVTCDAGWGCFVSAGATPDEGVCTPICNPDNQTDQTTWGLPCDDAIGGGEGVCRPFLRNVELIPGAAGSTPVAICTNACDPLTQECPQGFSCDLVDTGGALAVWSFACVPALKSKAPGASCEGQPMGECAAGNTCNDGVCQTFCDSEAALGACSEGQSCTVMEWFPAGSTVGVCVDQ